VYTVNSDNNTVKSCILMQLNFTILYVTLYTRHHTEGRDVNETITSSFYQASVITSLCLDTVSARMGVGHLLLPTQLSGTH